MNPSEGRNPAKEQEGKSHDSDSAESPNAVSETKSRLVEVTARYIGKAIIITGTEKD